MVNTIYFIVAILMFVSWIRYFGDEENAGKWTKRFYLIMQIIFFVSNIVCILTWENNEYWRSFIAYSSTNNNVKIPMVYIICGIPILIYVIEFIYHILKRKTGAGVVILWLIYGTIFVLCVVFTRLYIGSKEVIQEDKNIIEYKEEVVRSTFFIESIEGIDYIIKQQDAESGKEEDKIISTRENEEDIKVEIYPHQEKSHIEKCVNIEEYLTYFGNTYEEEGQITYKIYLTDEFQQTE